MFMTAPSITRSGEWPHLSAVKSLEKFWTEHQPKRTSSWHWRWGSEICIIATLIFWKTFLVERKTSLFTNIYTNLPGVQFCAAWIYLQILICFISSDLSKLQNLRDDLFKTLNALEGQNQQKLDERSDQESLYSSFSETFQITRIQYCENHAWMNNVTNNDDGYRRVESTTSLGEMTESDKKRLPLFKSRRPREKVILNIGGEKHEVMWRMLEKHPRSRLGLLALSNSSDQVDRERLIVWTK